MEIAIGAALISTTLRPFVDLAMEKAFRKVDDIVNIKKNISKLQTTLIMIEGIGQEAEENQIDKKLNEDQVRFTQNWLRDLVDIAYEARDVLDDFITYSSITASKQVNFFSSLYNRNRLANDIRSVRKRFDKKMEEGKTFATLQSVVLSRPLRSEGKGSERPIVGPSTNKQRDDQLVGRGGVKEEIMEKILHPSDDNRVHVVAIWGMGGIGKTFLVQSIYNDERVKEDDYPTKNRKWVGVGENKLCAEKVIKEILDDQNTSGIGNLDANLQKKLKGDRFLIVLDDVWDVDGSEWNLLFNPLTHVGKGGMIIITTRKREVCTATKTQTRYELKHLSEEDSWSIFERCAFVNGKSDSTPELKHIGKEIVKKLNGLPLALKVVGCSLLNKDSSTWTNFLESNEWKLTNDNDVMSALRWSFNHFPRHLKMCFTYCALFPKDRVLDKKVLVEMWMAHDLIQKKEQERPEDVGTQYFEELVNASLLQCVDGENVMHDLIHDLALLVSNGEFASVNSSPTNDQIKKVRHLTITPGDYSKIPSLCKIEKLFTLYTTHDEIYTIEKFDDSVLDDVFKQMKSIRVLVLHSSKITYIPDCISELRHLRYLDVSETGVNIFPDSLCHLYNLQMLAAPPDAKLPRDIVKISCLRYVRGNLPTCKGVGKLTSLQELSSIHVCKGDNIRELGNMQRLHGKLTIEGLGNVEKLEGDVGALMDEQILIHELELQFDKQLEKSTISEEVLDSLGCPPNLAYLKIYGYSGLKPPSWMVDGKHKFDKLQTMYLCDCPKLKSLPPLGELTSLKHLFVANVGVKRLGDEFYGKVFFPSLESLRFSNMQEWEEWDDINIENTNVSFFPNLTKLVIDNCEKLISVLPVVKNPNAANFMKNLSSLEISYCDVLRSLPADGLPPSIRHLSIIGCPLLYERCKDESGLNRHKINHIPKIYIRP